MVISKPLLPPKDGYVEDIDENGKHYYRYIPQQGDVNDALSVDHEYRLTLLELGLNGMEVN